MFLSLSWRYVPMRTPRTPAMIREDEKNPGLSRFNELVNSPNIFPELPPVRCCIVCALH